MLSPERLPLASYLIDLTYISMWNRPQPRPKLVVHTTNRHLSDGARAKGSAKYLAVAIAIMVAVSHFVPGWFPGPKNFKPPVAATVPIERAAVDEPEPVAPLTAEVPSPQPETAPITQAADTPAWRKYAVPVTLDPAKAKIAIIIDDMGVNHAKSREVLTLPSVLTLSFLPYADGVAEMAQEGRAKGHEIMVHIPMEPMNEDVDPGPNALRTTMMPGELRTAIDANLAKFTDYVGINNHMGSLFTQDSYALKELMGILKDRGLFLLDSKTIGASQAYNEAKAAGVPAIERDVFLDDDPAYASVTKQIQRAEEIAHKKGMAVVIGHPKEDTIRALKEFLARADKNGIQIVPLSALVMMTEQENVAQEHLPPPEPMPEPSAPSP